MRFASRRQLCEILAGATLLSILAVACGGEEEENGIATPTGTATATPTSVATPAPTDTVTATVSFTPTATPVFGPPLTMEALTIQVSTDKEAYESGEPVTMSLTVAASESVTLHYRTSQRFEFTVADADGEPLWLWSADRAFLQVLGQEVVEPGLDLAYEAGWRQTDSEGNPVPPGVYTVTGTSTHCDENYDNCGEAAASTTIEIVGG